MFTFLRLSSATEDSFYYVDNRPAHSANQKSVYYPAPTNRNKGYKTFCTRVGNRMGHRVGVNHRVTYSRRRRESWGRYCMVEFAAKVAPSYFRPLL
jgi:hypothetical protein